MSWVAVTTQSCAPVLATATPARPLRCCWQGLLGPFLTLKFECAQVANDNSWSDLVLFGFVAGLFIYVGTCEITAEEFAALDTPEGRVGKPKSARFWLFGALFFGFTVVALLQLVPGN